MQTQTEAGAIAPPVAKNPTEELALLRVRCDAQEKYIAELEASDNNGSVMQRKLLAAAEERISALSAQVEELTTDKKETAESVRHLAALLGAEIALVQRANEAGIEGGSSTEIVRNLMEQVDELKKLNGVLPKQLNQILRRREQNLELGERILKAAEHVVRNKQESHPAPSIDVAAVVAASVAMAYCPNNGQYTSGMSFNKMFGFMKQAVGQLTGVAPDGLPRSHDDVEALVGDTMRDLVLMEEKILDWANLYTLLRSEDSWGEDDGLTTNDWHTLGEKSEGDFDDFVRAKFKAYRGG